MLLKAASLRIYVRMAENFGSESSLLCNDFVVVVHNKMLWDKTCCCRWRCEMDAGVAELQKSNENTVCTDPPFYMFPTTHECC